MTISSSSFSIILLPTIQKMAGIQQQQQEVMAAGVDPTPPSSALAGRQSDLQPRLKSAPSSPFLAKLCSSASSEHAEAQKSAAAGGNSPLSSVVADTAEGRGSTTGIKPAPPPRPPAGAIVVHRRPAQQKPVVPPKPQLDVVRFSMSQAKGKQAMTLCALTI